jgi:hypothetical protein
MRLIHAFAQADPALRIFLAKWDIKDGFWRLVCQSGAEWNFCYVLPQEVGEPTRIVAPSSLQMGWIESPGYFTAASETGRDIAAQLTETPVGSLPQHKFLAETQTDPAYAALPKSSGGAGYDYCLEVFVDDYLALAIPQGQDQLDHSANSVMHGVHSVFPPHGDANEDSLSYKKLKKGEGSWAVQKDCLGFEFDGEPNAHTICLGKEKRDAILATLSRWIRQKYDKRVGIPYEEFDSTVEKSRHAFTAVPAGNGLMSP